MSSKNSFNFLFLKRFIHIFHILIPFSCNSLNIQNYKEHIYSHPLFLILIITINEISLEVVIYFVGLIPSEYYSALIKSPEERNFSAFRWLLIRSFGLVALNAILKSISNFLASILYIKWRTKLVIYLHSLYFTQQRYYHLLNTTQQQNQNYQTIQTNDDDRNSIDYKSIDSSISSILPSPSIDNPDQRITQDVDILCRSLSFIIVLIFVSPFTISYYTYRVWSISGYYGPLGIFIYFILWTIINKIFISSVSRKIFEQNISEGDFRFLHTQIRIYNEPIAFYNGGIYEQIRFNNYFLKILSPKLYNRIKREFFLTLSTNLYDYISSIISYLLLALAIFIFHMYDNVSHNELVIKISQTSFIAGYLTYQFNKLNDLTDKLTLISANTHRIQSFIEYMKNINIIWNKNLNENNNNEILIIKNLSYSIPNNNKYILMKNLNLILNQGQRLLITGSSGVGKTSLFRVLHSIWPININGTFSFKINHAYLLPQRPYFTNRSLYDELFYPNIENFSIIECEKQIEQYLIEWNLLHIFNYVQSNIYVCPKYAWQDLLSPGELQRLSFIRLLLRYSLNEYPKLNLIFLDEITSSIDKQMEMKIYNYLIEKNLTLISIGHRQTLRQYHQIELHIEENGNYIIENIV